MSPIVVAGAGIAGLTTALALAEAGRDVIVLERRTVLGEAGAGLQLSPNATRCLRTLGVLEAVRAHSTTPEAVRIRRARDGADIARMTLGTVATARYGAPFLLLHRADLHRVLLETALRHPSIAIERGATVTDVADRDALEIAIDRGGNRRVIEAAGFVGAAGLHGRSAGLASARARFSGRTAWRALVEADRVNAAARQPLSNLWLGPRAHLVHYPLRGGSIVNLVVIVDTGPARSGELDPWAVDGDPAELAQSMRKWDPEALRLIGAADAWRRWPLYDAEPSARWSSGRCVAIGDAAHPMLPFLAQGASQAIEDAAALARAVTNDPDAVPAAFAAFERARRPVAERVQVASRRQGQIYHLGGAAAAARDLAMTLLGPQRMLSRLDWLYGTAPDPSSG